MDEETGPSIPDWGIGNYERTAALLAPAARVLVDAAGVLPGERVIDLGCGTGNAALLAAAAGAVVTAVDPSDRLLAVTAASAQERGLEVSCALGHAGLVPVPDAACDVVVSNFGVIFAPDADVAVGEMARVLDPQGRVALTAWLPGGALGALANAAEQLVRKALGAPPSAAGFAWHDEAAVSRLFARHEITVEMDGPHQLIVEATSAEDFLDSELTNHPLAVSGFAALERHGLASEAYKHLLQVVREHNEDDSAFRSASRYVVWVARRT